MLLYSSRRQPSSAAQPRQSSSTCKRRTCESKVSKPYYDQPGIVLQDYSKGPQQSCEKYKFRRPLRKMFPQHVCACDNNVLGLSNRRSVSPDGKILMFVHESVVPGCQAKGTERSKSLFNVTRDEPADFSFAQQKLPPSPESTASPLTKARVRQMLVEKFRKIYEEQRPHQVCETKMFWRGEESSAAIRREKPTVKELLRSEMQRVQTARTSKRCSQQMPSANTGWNCETIDYSRINEDKKERRRKLLRESISRQLWTQQYIESARKENLGKVYVPEEEFITPTPEERRAALQREVAQSLGLTSRQEGTMVDLYKAAIRSHVQSKASEKEKERMRAKQERRLSAMQEGRHNNDNGDGKCRHGAGYICARCSRGGCSSRSRIEE